MSDFNYCSVKKNINSLKYQSVTDIHTSVHLYSLFEIILYINFSLTVSNTIVLSQNMVDNK